MDVLATNEEATGSAPVDARPNSHDLQVGLMSNPGCVRDRNEDASLAWQCLLAQGGQSPWPLGLYIVADGMGGHASGELASGLAVRLAADHVLRHVCLPLLGDDAEFGERRPIHEVLESSVRLAHQAILRRLPEAGTTFSLALVMGDGAYLAHVGDSRIYLGEHRSDSRLDQGSFGGSPAAGDGAGHGRAGCCPAERAVQSPGAGRRD